MNNHDISDETVDTLETYLQANGLCDVKVRINQYSRVRSGSGSSRTARCLASGATHSVS